MEEYKQGDKVLFHPRQIDTAMLPGTVGAGRHVVPMKFSLVEIAGDDGKTYWIPPQAITPAP